MNRLIILIRQFYRPLWLFNIAFTVIGLLFIMKYGLGTISNSLLIKLAGYFASALYQFYMANKSYYYFRNAGYSVRRMYAYVFSIDFAIYIILILLYTLLHHEFAHIKG